AGGSPGFGGEEAIETPELQQAFDPLASLSDSPGSSMRDLTPTKLVSELDRYIVGQAAAKRAVAVAVRNRWRRMPLPPEQREEITPKNLLLIGNTGVGKTEIARRMAALVNAPMLKVEASKYTEVGYVGRDVESMVRDLLDVGIDEVRSEMVS